ncbi:signal recognition particle-docking protein FtsY [Pseudoroseicyclus sp. H15]
MSFFTKLKDRLFTSSSKLDAGIDAIVSEAEETDETLPVDAAPPVPEVPEPPRPPEVPDEPEPEPVEEPGPVPDPNPLPDPPEEPQPPMPEPPDMPPPGEVPETPELPEPPGGLDVPTGPVTPGGAGPVDDDPEETEATSPILAEARPMEMPVPEPVETTPAAPRGGIMSRVFRRGGPAADVPRRLLDDDMLEQLEELLIASDMGVVTSQRVTANIAEGRMGRRMTSAEIKGALATEIGRIMEPVARPLPLYPSKPQVVLVVGVNGSGKTTTIGKLASQFRDAGKSVVIAAGDTFRAAAVEQLQVWGERAGVPVMTAPEGSDPASLAFEAMEKARTFGADLLLIDTAGRLQNRQDLMEELAKIVRVIRKKDPDAPHNTLLVLDATTGQNALTQVEIFQKIADVSGLVMTKLDGTARGGVLVALADKFGLPIHAIGVGEQIDDLAPFDPEEFAAALVGTELEPA